MRLFASSPSSFSIFCLRAVSSSRSAKATAKKSTIQEEHLTTPNQDVIAGARADAVDDVAGDEEDDEAWTGHVREISRSRS